MSLEVEATPIDGLQQVCACGTTCIVLLTFVGAAVLVPSACGTASHLTLRIYDPTGQAKSEVTTADVVRSSARASREHGGSAVLFFRLMNEGSSKFHSLTRALARRGARIRRRQPFAFEIDGRVYARPLIDYRAYPDGLDGRPGLQMEGLRLETAQLVARHIREG